MVLRLQDIARNHTQMMAVTIHKYYHRIPHTLNTMFIHTHQELIVVQRELLSGIVETHGIPMTITKNSSPFRLLAVCRLFL